MKKTILAGFVSELTLSAMALACLVVASIFGQAAIIVASVVVMLALLYIAGGFYAEHVRPGTSYFNWVAWFWNVFCVEWVWNTFCVAWVWQTFCKEWVWNTFCVAWIWQGFCVGVVSKLFSKKNK